MKWLSGGVPTGTNVTGRGFEKIDTALKPDREHGKAIYAQRCAACHGAEGQGLPNPQGGYAMPPLWGKDSFNVGAGMARTYTAAAFVKHNMPLGQGGTLTAQEAVDVAAFFTHQPRPDFAARTKDWPKGDRPKDAR
jgi:thiosulfate dehydrogenase